MQTQKQILTSSTFDEIVPAKDNTLSIFDSGWLSSDCLSRLHDSNKASAGSSPLRLLTRITDAI